MITNYNNHQIGPFTPVGIWTPPRLGSAAPFTWTPSDITSITTKLYLEGDSKTVSGSTLLSAVDKSGNGNNYAGNNMTWAADPTANNQDVFQFNGSTGYLDRSSTQIHPNYAAACTHIIFFEPSDLPGSGDFRIISTFNTDLSGGNQGYFNYISSGAIGSQLPMSSGYAEGNNTGADVMLTTNYQLWITVFAGGSVTDPANFKFWFNGAAQTVGTRIAGTGNSMVNEIGRYPGGLFYLNGKMGFTLMGAGALSDAEAALTYQYAQHQYGL